MNAQNNYPSLWSKVTGSITFKAASIAFLILPLLIPINLAQDLIRERSNASEAVEKEVCSKWGNRQTFTGPIIKVPYTYAVLKTSAGKGEPMETEVEDYAYFLPEELGITANMAPEILHRSIYDVVVYQSKLHVRGYFKQPDFSQLNVKPLSVDWENACLYLGISDMRGVRNKVVLNWEGGAIDAIPGIEHAPVLTSGVTIKIPLKAFAAADTQYAFDCELLLNGSKELAFTPVGKSTQVEANSAWTSPGFEGAFLPEQRSITAEGFTASWKVFNYNRNYPQAWTGEAPSLEASDFSVKLVLPVDHYQQSTRAVKYAVMFIVLTFLLFFMVEVISRKPVHIIQYLLVSAGLILFYSLLLALSEQMNFTWAYIISAMAIVGLITGYSHSIFREWKQTVMAGGLFCLLYLFLYILLQLEDLALLIGSLGLFITLAVTMYMSRKIDWFQSRE